MSLNTTLGFIHNHEYGFTLCLCFVFLKISTIDLEEIGCIEELSCPVSLLVFVLTGSGRLELAAAHSHVALNNNNKRKSHLRFLLFSRSCMPPFACILQIQKCIWLRGFSKFLNHNLSPLSLLLSLGSSHSERHKNLYRAILSDFPPSTPFCLKYMSKFILLFCLCLLFFSPSSPS